MTNPSAQKRVLVPVLTSFLMALTLGLGMTACNSSDTDNSNVPGQQAGRCQSQSCKSQNVFQPCTDLGGNVISGEICSVDSAAIDALALFEAMSHHQGSAATHAFLNPQNSAGMTPQQYCAQFEGSIVELPAAVPGQTALCQFQDRTSLGLETLVKGPKDPGNQKLSEALQSISLQDL